MNICLTNIEIISFYIESSWILYIASGSTEKKYDSLFKATFMYSWNHYCLH